MLWKPSEQVLHNICALSPEYDGLTWEELKNDCPTNGLFFIYEKKETSPSSYFENASIFRVFFTIDVFFNLGMNTTSYKIKEIVQRIEIQFVLNMYHSKGEFYDVIKPTNIDKYKTIKRILSLEKAESQSQKEPNI